MTTLLLALAQTTPAPVSPWRAYLPLVLMVGVFYFVLIRPRQREVKQHQQMVAELEKGDAVVTAGGLIGEIAAIRENEVTVRTGTATVVVERQRIVRRTSPKAGGR